MLVATATLPLSAARRRSRRLDWLRLVACALVLPTLLLALLLLAVAPSALAVGVTTTVPAGGESWPYGTHPAARLDGLPGGRRRPVRRLAQECHDRRLLRGRLLRRRARTDRLRAELLDGGHPGRQLHRRRLLPCGSDGLGLADLRREPRHSDDHGCPDDHDHRARRRRVLARRHARSSSAGRSPRRSTPASSASGSGCQRPAPTTRPATTPPCPDRPSTSRASRRRASRPAATPPPSTTVRIRRSGSGRPPTRAPAQRRSRLP